MKNPSILYIISLETDFLLYLIGKIAFGCNILLNCKKPFLIINKCLITLNPPAVLPAEPPININPKKISKRSGAQLV